MKRSTHLKKPRYDFVKKSARELLLNSKIEVLPVDVDYIFKVNKIILLSDEQSENLANIELPYDFKNNRNIHAITQKHVINNGIHYVTIYKTKNRTEGNIRFSKAHELGHIFLDHFSILDNQNGINTHNSHLDWIIEREAEIFAAELLAPTAILRACNCLEAEKIKDICNISAEASQYVLSDIGRDYHLTESDKTRLELQFNNFIRSKSYLKITEKLFCSTCGNVVYSNHSFCGICGHSDFTIDNSLFKVYPNEIQLREIGKVYYCYRCGNDNFNLGSNLCNVCDSPLYNICSMCKKKLDGNIRFCTDCGTLSPFLKSKLLKNWVSVKKKLDTPSKWKELNLRKIEYWDFILNKILENGEYKTHYSIFDSCGYDDFGKLLIACSSKNSNEIIVNKEGILQMINDICLPYFDLTFDNIDFKFY